MLFRRFFEDTGQYSLFINLEGNMQFLKEDVNASCRDTFLYKIEESPALPIQRFGKSHYAYTHIIALGIT